MTDRIDPYKVIEEVMRKDGWPEKQIRHQLARLRDNPSENSIVSVIDRCVNEIGPAIGRVYTKMKKERETYDR